MASTSKNNHQVLLSKIATNEQHGENSPYFDGWKAYDKDPFHPNKNPNGVIQMGLAENQLCLDLIGEWVKKNPKASVCTSEGINQFKDISNFQDYHGLPQFRNAVAKFMGSVRRGSVTFDPNRIIMSGGATGANELIMFCLANPGEAFLIPTPYYPAFDRDLRWRTGIQLIPINCHSSNNFQITKEALEEAYEIAIQSKIKVKGLILANPSNPLGTILDKETLKMLVTFINCKNIHLVCDEIYSATVFNAPNFISVAEIIQEVQCNCDRIHIIYSLSKDMGLPGFRVGIVYSYNDEVVKCGRKMSSFGLVSSQTQHLLASMLLDEVFVGNFLIESSRRLRQRHRIFTEGLKDVGVNCLKSNAGLFCWMDLRSMMKEATFEGEMMLWRMIIDEVKLNVSPGFSFHCIEPGWFRVCFANMDYETMEIALTRIRVFVSKQKRIMKETELPVKMKMKWQKNLRVSFSSRIYDESSISPHSPLVRART